MSLKIIIYIQIYIVCINISTNFFYRDAINDASKYKDNPTDIEDQILEELDKFTMDEPKGDNLEL